MLKVSQVLDIIQVAIQFYNELKKKLLLSYKRSICKNRNAALERIQYSPITFNQSPSFLYSSQKAHRYCKISEFRKQNISWRSLHTSSVLLRCMSDLVFQNPESNLKMQASRREFL